MSLGRYRGAALVGRPLDISVQAVLNAQDDPAALCIEADAFYADNQLDKSLVRVSTEKVLSNPLDTVIRIRSSVPVDEPVVTLNVRVGCQQKTERRYVILADLASEPVGLPSQPFSAGTGTGSSPTPLAARGNSSADISGVLPSPILSIPPSTSTLISPSMNPAATAPARPNSARPATVLTGGSRSGSGSEAVGQTTASSPEKNIPVARRDTLQARSAGASGQSTAGKARLKLEPLDLSIEYAPQLKSSKELLSTPAAGEPQRSAAAALWRALMAQPQDIVRDAEKIQSLDNSLNTLRVQIQKNQLALNESNSQLEKTRLQRYANWLVYALGMLLILALAGLVYLWRLRTLPDATRTNELPWWRKNKPLEKGWTNNLPESAFPVSPDPGFAENTDTPAFKYKKKKNAESARTLLNPDSALGADESSFTEVRHISRLDSDFGFSPSSSLDFTVSMPQVARSVKAEELFDIQQQADFFVSLGQYEQAVDLLREHIASNNRTSPLVYMDLFNLYHLLDRQTDYEALRKDFNQLFTGKIPAFELYTQSSAGLEAYPVALTRIEALWPSPKVLEVIEESILRRPVASADAFDLEAYRELLLLYAVAKELVRTDGGKDSGALRFDLPDLSEVPLKDSTARASEFSLTSIQPLSASADESVTQDVGLQLAPRSPRLALDVDLNNLVEAGATNAPSPGVAIQSNSNFFARLGTKMPASSSVRPPGPAVPHVSPAKDDNLIDFDDFDAFLKNLDEQGPPKA